MHQIFSPICFPKESIHIYKIPWILDMKEFPKNWILMKILEFKRSGIRKIAEFRGIPSGFPNQAKNSSKKTKLGSYSKKLGLSWSEKHLKEAQPPLEDTRKRLIVKHKTIRVILDTGLSGDLHFLKKGSNKYVPIVNRAVPESWSTSNGTFKTKKVGEVELFFINYSASKKGTCARI